MSFAAIDNGKIAGAVVGSILGAALIVAVVAVLIYLSRYKLNQCFTYSMLYDKHMRFIDQQPLSCINAVDNCHVVMLYNCNRDFNTETGHWVWHWLYILKDTSRRILAIVADVWLYDITFTLFPRYLSLMQPLKLSNSY